ncbi:MAG: metallophosphoesterase family protein [Planctomycetes bacterium]|nr:metallophosphoesterase family protein [Planctomycetota bacterium]
MKRHANILVAVLVLAGAAAVGVLTGPTGLSDERQANPDPLPETVLEGTTPAQWRLVWTTDPAHEATVGWTTAEAAKTNAVFFDTEPRQGALDKYRHQQAATATGRYSARKPALHYASVELKKLRPGTTYWFVMVSDESVSREFHFITAPEGDAEFKFLYGGDSRSYREPRREMNRRLRALFTQDPEILALVHGGDYVEDGDKLEQWVEWLTDHELTVTAQGRMLPIVPARGNHEADSVIFDEVFHNPGGKGLNYYATRLGSEFLLVNLNTEISAGGDQAAFLETTLKNHTTVRWQCANYHRPAYPAVKKPGSALKYWVPVFERYDLDVALESDGHTYKRTCAIRGGKPDATGVTYIGEGGLGVRQRTPDPERWYFEGGKVGSSNHVQKVTVRKDKLLVETIAENGKQLDTWEAKPRPTRRD